MTWTIIKPFADSEMQRKAQWCADMLDAAPPSADVLGVSIEGIVAQSALETGWGRYVVGQHNLYGIKATPDWTGKRVLVKTREVLDGQSVMESDWFRDYDSFADSIADHLAFLQQNTIYRDAGVFARMGDRLYFQALKNAGYATDPDYASSNLAVCDTIRSVFEPRMVQGKNVPGLPPQAPAPRWLMIGCQGADVVALQIALGINDPDGVFGRVTQAVLQSWQAAHGQQADGVAGDKTRAALKL